MMKDEPSNYEKEKPKTSFSLFWFLFGLGFFTVTNLIVKAMIWFSRSGMTTVHTEVKETIKEHTEPQTAAAQDGGTEAAAGDTSEAAADAVNTAAESVVEPVAEVTTGAVPDASAMFGDYMNDMLMIVCGYGLFEPFCYFLGGLIIGWRSNGNTILEPALAAIIVAPLLSFIGFLVMPGGSMVLVGCSTIFLFFVALIGAFVGEKIQGPSRERR